MAPRPTSPPDGHTSARPSLRPHRTTTDLPEALTW